MNYSAVRRESREATEFLATHPEVRAFHCFLTDLGGVARGKVLRSVELERAFSDGRPLPGSILGLDITGADVEETGLVWEDGDADRLCWPVAGTLVPQPWSDEPSAQFLLTSYEADGSGSPGDPRHALARVIDRFKPLGVTPVAAVELEFYLFDPSVIETGKPLPPLTAGGARPSQLQAYLMQDLEDFAPFLDDLYRGGEAMGLPLRTLISEYAPGQLEVVLQHRADAMRAADEAILYKRLVKGTAQKHGFVASFMAKPYAEHSGCGMHLHVSLADAAGDNAFADPAPEGGPLLRHAIGGLKATMAEAMAIFAPGANSYRRFRANSYAPMAPTWGVNNRTVSLRVPAGAAETRHIEHRVAGADANPYLGLAAVLAGMHRGIVDKLDPGPAVSGNGYAQRSEATLPRNWYAAIEAAAQSRFLADYLGQRTMEIFLAIKRAELDRFMSQPGPLDFAWYLRQA